MTEYYSLKAKDFIPLWGAIKYRDTMELEMKSHPEDRGRIIGTGSCFGVVQLHCFYGWSGSL